LPVKEVEMGIINRFCKAFLLLVVFLFCNLLTVPAIAQQILTRITIPQNGAADIAYNPALNKIYVSGGASGGQVTAAVDGATYTVTQIGTGSGAAVDIAGNRVWTAGVYDASIHVYDGVTNALLTTVNLGNCPIYTAVDSSRRRVWVSGQCGGGNDPVWVVNADTYAVLQGPIGSGGILGKVVVNGATGHTYINPGNTPKRINAASFAVTTTAFRAVLAANAATNKLYALDGTKLQVIDGATEPETLVSSIPLSFSPGASSMAVNEDLNRIYIINPAGNSVEVLDGAANSFLGTIALGSGVSPYGVAVDPTGGRIFVLAGEAGVNYLYVVPDLPDARADIQATLAAALTAYNNKDLDLLMSYFSPSYLDNGKTYDMQRLDFMSQFTGPISPLPTLAEQIVVNGNSATAFVPGGPGTMYLIKTGDNWLIYGNQQKYGVKAFSGYEAVSSNPNSFFVELEVQDPTDAILGVSVTGNGLDSPRSLNHDPVTHRWVSWGPGEQWNIPFGNTMPTGLPFTYTFVITDGTGQITQTAQVKRFLTVYPETTTPAANTILTAPPVFSWSPVSGPYTYGVELNDAAYNQIWNRFQITGTSVAYDGPPLADGKYYYNVMVRDEDGNFSMVTVNFTYEGAYVPWSTKASMPAARSQALGAVIDGLLYLAGGWDGHDTPALQAYNPAANTWSTLASMPGGRYGSSGAAVMAGKLYVPGGWTTSPGLPNGNLYVYDPQTNAWTEKAPLPNSRLTACGAAGVINGKMYMTTACNGYNGYRNFLDVYDPATNGWTSLAASQVAHGYPAWGVIDNKLYVAGGHTDNGSMGNTLEVYDPATNTWTTKAPLPVAGVGFASGVVNGKLYVTGGTDAQSNILPDLYIYDPATDIWTKKEAAALPTPRVHAASGVVNGTFYVAGGQNPAISPSPLDVVEAYTPPAAESGLVAYYPFNGSADDESGNGHHGVINNAVLTADRFGNAGRAYLFGATDAYIVIPNSRNLKFNTYSLLAWVKILPDSMNDEMMIVGQHICGYGNGYFLGLYYGHRIRFYPYLITSESYGDNKWHLLAAVADGARMNMYVDGLLVNSAPGSVGGGDQYDADLTIGRFFNAGTSFKGVIDDVRLFNRALSPVEIQSLYREGGWQGEQTNYNLSAAVSGTGSGSVTTDKGVLTWTGNMGTASYVEGALVTLTAAPAADATFGGWTGCDTVNGNQCAVTMNADRQVGVVFNDRYGVAATTGHFPGDYTVALSVTDPGEAESMAASVSVTGPGIGDALALDYDVFSRSWVVPGDRKVHLGAGVPVTPLSYAFTITRKAGGVVAKQLQVADFVQGFIADPLPAEAQKVTGALTFSWTGIAGSGYDYGVELYQAAGGRIWSKYGLATVSVAYDGVQLDKGGYYYNVVARDAQGNFSMVTVNFTYEGATAGLKGDINGDGRVDMADALLILKAVVGMEAPGIRADYTTSGADVNGDGKAGFEELLYILQTLAGRRESSATPSYKWKYFGIGDCFGRDVKTTTSGTIPAGEACSATFTGMTAVCWDGVNYKNFGSSNQFCTYKDLPPSTCTGGSNPGYMYECVYE